MMKLIKGEEEMDQYDGNQNPEGREASQEEVIIPLFLDDEEKECHRQSVTEGHAGQRSIIQMAPPASTSPSKSKQFQQQDVLLKQKRRLCCTVENCPYATPYSKDLARHMRKHTGEKPYVCDRDMCTKSYSRHDKLVIHLRTHDNIKPFECDECSYAAVDSGSLRKHKRSHTDERPYKCQVCPYAARESQQLVVHLRRHTGDSPYFCTETGCDAAFKTPSDLKRHCRVHTKEKPYACHYCPYQAAIKCNLNVHLRKHRDKPSPVINQSEEKTNSPHSQDIVSSPKTTCTGKQPTESQNDVSNSPPFNSALPSSHVDHSKLNTERTIDISNNFKSCFQVAPVSALPVSTLNENVALTISSSSTFPSRPISSTPPPHHSTGKEKTVENAIEKEKPQPHRTSHSSNNLPFQFACKQCSFKADTLKIFVSHMKKIHGITTSVAGYEREKLKLSKRRVGRPRPSRRTQKVKQNESGNELEKFYDCDVCMASFVREDSLRCHLKQHSPATTSHPKLSKTSILMQEQDPLCNTMEGDEQEQRGGSTSAELFFSATTNYQNIQNFCFQSTRPITISLGTGEEKSNENPPLTNNDDQVANSVIAENPAATAVLNAHHNQLYIVSPGGNSLQLIERDDFQFNSTLS